MQQSSSTESRPVPTSRWMRIVFAFLAVIMINVVCSIIASVLYAAWFAPASATAIPIPWGKMLLVLSAAVLGFWMGKRALAGYFHIETRPMSRRDARQRRALIWFLSVGRPLPPDLVLSTDLESDLRRLAENKKATGMNWSWEQPLRGIWHNLKPSGRNPGPLERLVLICSPESLVQIKQFGEIIQRYTQCKKMRINVWLNWSEGLLKQIDGLQEQTQSRDGWDFEAFDVMYEGLVRLLAELERDGIGLNEIAIDLTAGQKPTSVAAAAATIGRPVVNQYVCTNPRDRNAEIWDYDVLEYDLLASSQATE